MSNNTKQTEISEIEDFKIEVTESKALEYPVIDDGAYEADLVKITLKANVPDGKGGYFSMLTWYFMVNADGYKEVLATSSDKISTMSKAYAWVTAINGSAPEINKDFNPNSLKGKKCQVIVKNSQVEKEFNGKKTTYTIPKITEVLRSKKGK